MLSEVFEVTDDIAVSTSATAFALGLLGLLAGVLLWTFPARGSVSLQLYAELLVVVLPLAGLLLVARLGLPRSVVRPLFAGLFLFGAGAVTDVVDEAVVVSTPAAVLLEDITVLAGTFALLVGLYRWNQERDRRERLLETRQRRLAELNAQLEVLTRLMRHDISNDMAVATGWASLLDEHVDDEGKEALDRVVSACENVAELTDTAADLIRVLAADEEERLQTKPVDVAAVLDEGVRKLRDRFDDVTVAVDHGEGVTGTTVVANELLNSVFANVLANAVVHNDRDDPRVTVTTEVDDLRVRVRIADDGPGIPDERKRRIFEKNVHALDSGGTGIGLYLVQDLLNRYGGSIQVVDNEPRGTVFVIDLPVAI